MEKITIFILRASLFIFSYFLYLINLILIFLKLKNISKIFFIYSSYFCSKSLGLSYKINKQFKTKLYDKAIHIANHDNPLDIFVAQYFFRMPTITTVENHLKKILPFFQITLKNFGHFTFNHLDQTERKSAYLFLKNICKKKRSVLIYPSGSIYTSINKRFSRSISKLSMAYSYKVIAWKLSYRDNSSNNNSYSSDIYEFILKRFLSENIVFCILKVKVFKPSEFSSEEDYHNNIKSFYDN